MTNQESNNLLYSESATSATNDFVPIVMQLWQIFRSRKKVILSTLYCFILAGGVYYFLAPRLYQSSAKLLIVEQKLDQLSAVGDHDSTGKTMATHKGLVVSPVVIQQAIEQLEPRYRIDLQGKPQREWADKIASQLSASTTRKTNFIDVSYRSLNPQAAAAIVNAVIQSYLDFVEKNHKGAAGEIHALLTEEKSQLERSLSQKQAELQQFRQQAGHLSTSAADGVVEPMIQRALRLNDALLDVKEKRLKMQATWASIDDSMRRGEDISQQLMNIESTLGKQMLLTSLGLSSQDLHVFNEQREKLLNKQQHLQSLSADFGPNHPEIVDLKQQIAGLQQYLSSYHATAGQRLESLGKSVSGEKVVNMLRQSIQQTMQQESQLLRSYEQARAEASSHSDALVQLHMLERDVLRKESLYDSLAVKIASLDISQGQAPIKATVVREPLPDEVPVTPQLRFVALFCFFGGTITGCCIAYVQDILDDRFNSPEELSSQLGVPVLAMVRSLEQLPGEGLATVHTNAMPTAVETEAFRTLRTSLSLSGNACDRVLISSSEPGDGKTTITANLSVAFAQAGKRTLVIDADLRRPGFTTLLNLKNQRGVADVLTSEQPPENSAPRLIHHTEVEGLDVLPVGFRRPNPAELLSSKAFVELLAWADSQYDRVIVDCPPVLAVSDAQIVGQLVDGAILVVRPEKNHRRSVMRAVNSFHSTGCRVLGVVANGLTSDSAGYGYGYGYGYSYGDSYGHSPEFESIQLPSPNHKDEEYSSTSTVDFTPAANLENPSQNRIRPRRAA